MKFVKVKVCSIPGFFKGYGISVYAEETVPDTVMKLYAVSETYGGNYDVGRMSITIKKMKEKDFLKFKTDIPDEFYERAGENK